MKKLIAGSSLVAGMIFVSTLAATTAHASLECSSYAAGSIFDTCISNTISGGSGGGSGKPMYMQSAILPK